MSVNTRMDRREMLRWTAGAALAAAPLSALSAQEQDQRRRRYGPFRMGLQSYSLRGYKLDEALQHTNALGVRAWEAYGGHIPLTTNAGEIMALREKLRAARVRMMAHGVAAFGADKAKNREVFEAAKAMGIPTISADPAPESFDNLEELVQEFNIKIAIHNHGPGHRYDKLEDVTKAVNGRHKLIGACVDTGHFLRSSENPVKVIETLGERVYGCHLKDVKDTTKFTILGEGDLDLVGTLRALRDVKFSDVLALEYEENPMDPIADIRKCLEAVRAAVEKLPPAA
ncbi:MAG: sugar phosphate isomerase/epimerase family protein [Armatimonadota bacterium]